MKKVSLIILLSIFIICLTSCETTKNKIYIIGNVEETIEVNSTYEDKGIAYPENYTLITKGEVDATHIGKYQIIYSVYSSDGELVKEVNRFVNVVDTTAPRVIEKGEIELYAGFNYTAKDFIEYSDNYDLIPIVEPTQICFSEEGLNDVIFEIKDSSGNKAVFSKKVDVKFDFVKLVEEVYKYSSYKITKNESMNYTHVSIENGKSISYFGDTTESIHYLENIKTSLGNSASIQISAKYGEFNNANISFHISGTSSSVYSVANAQIDATIENGTISNYRLMINNLGVDSDAVLEELTANISTIVNNFQTYMTETLHIKVK